MAYPKYEEDFYAWTQSTADLLRNKHYNQVDFEHVIEELDEMGTSNENQLISRFGVLIAHLLKWGLQPDFRCRSWEGTIDEQRLRLKRLLKKNPSLKNKVSEAIQEGFKESKAILKKETPIELSKIPADCPYSLEDMLRDDFYPK